jgi:CDP-paratose 2-epimerase
MARRQPNGSDLHSVVPLHAPRPASSAGRIVVTGGAGFLGSNLVDRLAAAGRNVLVVDNLSRPRVEENLAWLRRNHPRHLGVAVGDIRDPGLVADSVRGASAVIHLAAQVAVTTSVADPVTDFEINARGTLNVLEAIRRHAPQAALLFASTNKVYGQFLNLDGVRVEGDRYVPVSRRLWEGVPEATPLDLYSPYGCSKGVADQYVLDYARVFGLKTAVFRMSCLYGPRQFGTEDQGWVAHFMISAMKGQPITIYGDGRQVRDILYVDDAVAAYLAALERAESLAGRVFNLGGGPANTLSLRELLLHVERCIGVAPTVRYGGWRPGDQPWYVSDTRAFTSAAGWQPRVDMAEGLRRLTGWLAEAVSSEPTREKERELSA